MLFRTAPILLALAAAGVQPAHAIVVDASRDAEHAVVSGDLGLRYAGVGSVSTGCTGVAVSRSVVLSAAHCFAGDTAHFELFDGGRSTFRSRASIELHPDYDGGVASRGDLALMMLDTALPDSAAIYALADFESAPLGSVVELVGYGRTGTGRTGEQLSAPWARGSTMRYGFNELDASMLGGRTLRLDFDGRGKNKIGSAGLGVLESFPGYGDSGGPMFLGGQPGAGLEIGSDAWLAAIYDKPPLVLGIASFYVRYGNDPFGAYGATSGHTNVSTYLDWIAARVPDVRRVQDPNWWSNSPAVPVDEPAPALLLVLGIVILLAGLRFIRGAPKEDSES